MWMKGQIFFRSDPSFIMRFSIKLGLTRNFKAERTVCLIRVYLTESSMFHSIPPPPHDAAAPSRSRSHYRGFTVTLRHTTLGRNRLDEWSARLWDLYLTKHNTHNRRASMSPAGFEPTIPTSEGPQTHALERAATGIGISLYAASNVQVTVKEEHGGRKRS